MTRIGNRFAISQVAAFALAETRIVARATPGVLRYLVPIVAWAVAAVALGAVVGFSAVVLPPLGAFGIVAAVGVVLLWVIPEVPLVYPALIRKALLLMLVVNLSVPYYYMVEFGDLPWISVRRVAAFALIAPFLLAVASSSDVRRGIIRRVLPSSPLVICAAGYLVMAIASLPGSTVPNESMSALVDSILTWYLPFFAIVYVVKDEKDVILIFKIICFCALFNSASGILEFYFKHRFFADIFPRGMYEAMLQNNPTLAAITSLNLRNGLFRAASTFMVPLSFGEFEIIVIPIGLFFALHRQDLFERCLGWMVVIGGLAGIFVAGSRGGYIGLIGSISAFVAMWSIRKERINKGGMAPAVVGVIGAISFVLVIGMILFWGRAHNLVLGGGAEAASTQGRWDQWAAAWPLIKSNPITGHGLATGGFDIGSSIDSYIISLLVETGIPGFVFFAGIVLLSIWYGVRGYLTDLSESGALAGVLACSFIAFTLYRIALSQRENHTLIFCLLGIVVFLKYGYEAKRAKEPRSLGVRQRSYSPSQGRRGLETA